MGYLTSIQLDESIQVRVQTPMVDLKGVILVEILLDGESHWMAHPGNDVQQVTLEPRKVVHVNPRRRTDMTFANTDPR